MSNAPLSSIREYDDERAPLATIGFDLSSARLTKRAIQKKLKQQSNKNIIIFEF